jgi:nucleoside-diphosphate-sugar epimerase
MKILVTGATGFLGSRACHALAARGASVVGVGRNVELGAKLTAPGVAFVAADLRDPAAVRPLCRGVDCVVHSAALSSPWGRPAEFVAANVTATRTLLRSALEHGVKTFVHISSPSVYFDFTDRLDIAETDPVARRFASAYSASKYEAEWAVHQAAARGLRVVILRPRGIFGPGDTSIIPRIVAAHRAGALRVIGDGRNVVDLTHVDNVVHAIERAIACSAPLPDPVFNISNGEPVRLWDFINEIVTGVGLPRVTRRMPYAVAHQLAHAAEVWSRTFGGWSEPRLTRYTVGLLAKSQTLDIGKARRVLGYEPVVGMRAAIASVIGELAGDRAEVRRAG